MTTVPTTIPKIKETIVFPDKCLNGTFITNLCSNISDEELYSQLRKEIFESYAEDKEAKVFRDGENNALRVSDTKNEMKNFDSSNGLSLVDLGECENLLREAYNIPLDKELIIIKKERTDVDVSDKDVQFDIFNPENNQKLDMEICENTTVDLYVPKQLSEEEEKLINDLKDQGYDLFDLGDKFYREICTPYNSENGTDVLLDDREEFFYYPIAEKMVCQNNCEYSSYSMNTKYIKCECGKNAKRVALDFKHLNKDNAMLSFLSTFKSTNYKVMRCYNLVFNFKIFVKNYGSIITLIFFIVYIIYMIFYSFKEVNPLKVEISKILFNEAKKEEMANYNKFGMKQYQSVETKEKEKEKPRHKTKRLSKKKINPPKKQISKGGKHHSTGEGIMQTENEQLEVFGRKSRKNIGTKRTNLPTKSPNSNKSLIKKNSKRKIKFLELDDNKNTINKMNEEDSDSNSEKKNTKKYERLDNFELNNLDYNDACELDHRGFCKTYCSVLFREHVFLFTFFTWKDFNLFYIKIERFLTLLCIEMTMNGLFFIHESMHRKYVEGEELTFAQKLPQLLFTLIASHIIEVILCFFGMTDVHVYEIKSLAKNENNKENREKVINIIDKMKNKLVWFFVFTFLLFLFNWYFISAFCAVYQNTQKIFLRDSGISFLMSMIDPFIIYGATNILRYLSLFACCRKKLCCLYKLSDIIPIF